MTIQTLLTDMFDAALKAADPFHAIPPMLPERPRGRTVVLGAGKASARMAQAVEAAWGPCEGLVIVPHGAALPTQRIELIEASHPVPDQASETGARRILQLAQELGPDDLALFLISGGGSSLMALPGEGLSLADKQAVNRALLASGAPISEMNVLRKHLSAIKGGRLARAAAPARCVTLAISDVPGDDLSLIASGPTVPDESTVSEARTIVERAGIELAPAAIAFLASEAAETPGPDHPAFARAEAHVVAAPQASLEATAAVARAHGYTPMILGDSIEGEAREAGRVMAGIARQIRNHGQPASAPVALISGGETTVTLRGKAGKGGRCSEFLLGFALAAWDLPGVSALACDTDGRDGSEHNAGVVWTQAQQARADRRKAVSHLDSNDAYSFFADLDGLVVTGPTHTNVNDFRVILIEALP